MKSPVFKRTVCLFQLIVSVEDSWIHEGEFSLEVSNMNIYNVLRWLHLSIKWYQGAKERISTGKQLGSLLTSTFGSLRCQPSLFCVFRRCWAKTVIVSWAHFKGLTTVLRPLCIFFNVFITQTLSGSYLYCPILQMRRVRLRKTGITSPVSFIQ